MTALSNLNKVWDQLSTGKLTTLRCRLTRDADKALKLALNGTTTGTPSIAIASVPAAIMAHKMCPFYDAGYFVLFMHCF